MASKNKHPSTPERTPDGRYIIVNGRRWRASDPRLDPDVRQRLVDDLMDARRDLARARHSGDAALEADARGRVQRAKVALGERGTPWWERPEPGIDPNERET